MKFIRAFLFWSFLCAFLILFLEVSSKIMLHIKVGPSDSRVTSRKCLHFARSNTLNLLTKVPSFCLIKCLHFTSCKCRHFNHNTISIKRLSVCLQKSMTHIQSSKTLISGRKIFNETFYLEILSFNFFKLSKRLRETQPPACEICDL
jgi:hypothetical protein